MRQGACSPRQDTGAMTTQESTEYDLLGRTTSSTDVLGRVTTYAYSQDGLTVTQTVPSGATFITRSAPDGTVMEESGTGSGTSSTPSTWSATVCGPSRKPSPGNANRAAAQHCQRSRETLRTGVPNTVGGVIYTRNTYNARAAHQNADGRGRCGHDDGPDPCGNTTRFGNKTKET